MQVSIVEKSLTVLLDMSISLETTIHLLKVLLTPHHNQEVEVEVLPEEALTEEETLLVEETLTKEVMTELKTQLQMPGKITPQEAVDKDPPEETLTEEVMLKPQLL